MYLRGDEPLLRKGLTGWYEIEACLHGGDNNQAWTEVESLGKIRCEERTAKMNFSKLLL